VSQLQLEVREPQPIQSFSNETGNYIRSFGISTKLNGNNVAISKETGHDLVKQFGGHNFAIIPHALKGPTKGHYFGNDTEEDLLRGYATHSHGKITKILGPYYYPDGTNDYFYDFIIKLRDSKASAILQQYGPTTWTPFSISPHIMPIEGPDWNITKWRPVGTALVDRGAFGTEAIISKFCTGSAAECERSLGSSLLTIVPCEKSDSESAGILSSYVSKAASLQHTMPENNLGEVTNASTSIPSTGGTTTLLTKEPGTAAPLPTVNQISITAEELEKIKKEAAAKEEAMWKEKVTALETKDKINTLNNVWGNVKDPAVKEALIKKYQAHDGLKNVDVVKEIADDVLKHLSTPPEEDEKKEEGDKPAETGGAKKGSKASSLTKEPDIPEEDKAKKSKASALDFNAVELIQNTIMGVR